MLKVLKNLKRSSVSVIAIVILLCVQAWADLSLPDYTSKIVNNGIQSGGIEKAIPEFISVKDMENINLFVDENNKNTILQAYTLIENNITTKQKTTIEKYFGKNYKIEPGTIYILNDLEEEKENELLNIIVNPIM